MLICFLLDWCSCLFSAGTHPCQDLPSLICSSKCPLVCHQTSFMALERRNIPPTSTTSTTTPGECSPRTSRQAWVNTPLCPSHNFVGRWPRWGPEGIRVPSGYASRSWTKELQQQNTPPNASACHPATYMPTYQPAPCFHTLFFLTPSCLCDSTRRIPMESIPSIWVWRRQLMLTASCWWTVMPWVRPSHPWTSGPAHHLCQMKYEASRIYFFFVKWAEHFCFHSLSWMRICLWSPV